MILYIEAPLLSRTLLTKTHTIDIPRKDFRLNIERVWENDIIQIKINVDGKVNDLIVEVDRVHFYVGQRTEGGVPTSLLTKKLYGPNIIENEDNMFFEIDVEGHLNILLDNTGSLYPKTVQITKVFEFSSNIKYATTILRNLSFLTCFILLIYGFIENYDEITYHFNKIETL
jgi:hypothetical protein